LPRATSAQAAARHALPGPGPIEIEVRCRGPGRRRAAPSLGAVHRAYEAAFTLASTSRGDRELEGRGGGPPNPAPVTAFGTAPGRPRRSRAPVSPTMPRPSGDGVAGLRPLRVDAGREVKGPALIEEREGTCVGSGQTATVDAHYNLVATLHREQDSNPDCHPACCGMTAECKASVSHYTHPDRAP
jgi:hypothetical protein